MRAAALLFLSGTAALIYQVLWIKQLSLVVGVDVYAITTGVSAFFAGLGVGGYVFGRAAGRCAPFLLYAFLEIGSAGLGIGATLALAHAAAPFAILQAQRGLLAWIIPLTLVGVPAVTMGGTLPVLVRSLVPEAGRVGRAGGGLYAANTAGAILGALLAPFLLLPLLGVQRTAFAAAAINLTAAIAALAFTRPEAVRKQVAARSFQPVRLSKDARFALILYAIAGGIALGYEVVWSQTVIQFLSTRTFAFAVVLATYLAGLMAGSALYARAADRVRNAWGIFGLLIASAGFLALFDMAILGNWLMNWQTDLEEALRGATGNELAAMCGRFVVPALCIVFPPTVLLGAAFPAALRLSTNNGNAGRAVGTTVALNTAGGIAGTFLTGFFLVPALGLVGALGILASAAAAVGLLAATKDRTVRSAMRGAIFATGAATVLVGIVMPKDQLARLLPRTRSGGEVVFYEESPGGTVAVVEQTMGSRSHRRLYIQGVSNSGDAMTSLRYMRLQALLPLLIHTTEPRSALVIGLGTGITAGSLLSYPGLERRVCAELLPAVVHAATLFRGNFGAGSRDSRIDLRLRDGRRELLQNSERYDLITLEPPPPSAAGVVNLYSSDFYELARARLQPGGVLAQWWPLPTQNDEDSRSLVRSFLDSFPYASLWTTELHEMLLIGSPRPIELNVPRIASRFDYPAVSTTLSEVGISSAAALLATWVTGREGLERYAGGSLPVTDDRPRIEYATWVRPGEFVRVLPQLLALGTDPPLLAASEPFRVQVAQERTNLLVFYEAGLHAYKGERELWARSIQSVMKADGANPYYRWIVGESSDPGHQP